MPKQSPQSLDKPAVGHHGFNSAIESKLKSKASYAGGTINHEVMGATTKKRDVPQMGKKSVKGKMA